MDLCCWFHHDLLEIHQPEFVKKMKTFAFLLGFMAAMNTTRRLELRDRSKQMFDFAFRSYMQHAYPADEIDPINCVGKERDLDPDNW